MKRANLREIEGLNQRGGRTLSVVDLIEAGTLDIPVAGYLLARVAEGASFLCAAGPGGVGKTTLMATLLSFLPPGERIRTVTDPGRLGATAEPTCFLCHEIGAGPWYGYLWGEEAACFLRLRRCGRLAASLHADTPEEIGAQLLGPSVGAEPADLAAVELLLFMVRAGGQRRLSAVYESQRGEVLRWQRRIVWHQDDDCFVLEPIEAPARLAEATEVITALVAQGTRDLEEVMGAVAGFHAL